MATYKEAADPRASSRSAFSYVLIGMIAGLLGTTAAIATWPGSEPAAASLAEVERAPLATLR